jgi:hypothetical protein
VCCAQWLTCLCAGTGEPAAHQRTHARCRWLVSHCPLCPGSCATSPAPAQGDQLTIIMNSIITSCSCKRRQGASADKLHVKAATLIPLVGHARSKQYCHQLNVPVQLVDLLVGWRAKTPCLQISGGLPQKMLTRRHTREEVETLTLRKTKTHRDASEAAGVPLYSVIRYACCCAAVQGAALPLPQRITDLHSAQPCLGSLAHHWKALSLEVYSDFSLPESSVLAMHGENAIEKACRDIQPERALETPHAIGMHTRI